MTPGLAVVISLTGAIAARQSGALTPGGTIAAAGISAILLCSTGWVGALVLTAFFLPSMLVGRVGPYQPTAGEAGTEVRSAAQVLANGGPAAAGGLAEFLAPGLGLWIASASLAAASADTWATSIGRFSRQEPRLLGTRRRVPVGASGGVSLLGTFGGAAGAAAVAAPAAVALRQPILFGVTFAIGMAGMFLDSALGGLAQATFVCPACAVPSERRQHQCGAPTHLVKGWRWLDNDGVNAVTTLTAALTGAVAWFLR